MSFQVRTLRDKLNFDFYDELKDMPDSYVNYIHSSSSYQSERLEYLGDSVLDLIVSDILYESLEDLSPGDMTRLGSDATKNMTLAYMSLKKGICLTRNKRCADKLEILVGLIYYYTGKNIAFVERYLNDMFGLTNIIHELIHDRITALDDILDNNVPVYSGWNYGTCENGKRLDTKTCQSGKCVNITRERHCGAWSECINGLKERYLQDGTKEVELCNTKYGKCDKNGMRTVTTGLGQFTNEVCPEEYYEEDYITDNTCTNGKIIVYKKCKDPTKCTDIVWDSYKCDE